MKLKDRAYYTVVADDMEKFEGVSPPSSGRPQDFVEIIDGDAETFGMVRWDMAEETCRVLNSACREFMPTPDGGTRTHIPVEEIRAMFSDPGALRVNILRNGPPGHDLTPPEQMADLQDYYEAKEEGRILPRKEDQHGA